MTYKTGRFGKRPNRDTYYYRPSCPYCGDGMDVVDARRYAAGHPDLKDPFKRCIKIIDPFTDEVTLHCPNRISAGGSSGQSGSSSGRIARVRARRRKKKSRKRMSRRRK